jgi:hypothetical protein
MRCGILRSTDQHRVNFVPKISSTIDFNGFMLAEASDIHSSYDIKIFKTSC